MKKQRIAIAILLIAAFASIALIGCDGDGSEEVIIVEGSYYGYEPAILQNDSFDDIFIEAGIFGEILLVPGTAVELDVGPDIYCMLVYINGFFFEEICVASGDVIIFE
jgi:hypothetical protein